MTRVFFFGRYRSMIRVLGKPQRIKHLSTQIAVKKSASILSGLHLISIQFFDITFPSGPYFSSRITQWWWWSILSKRFLASSENLKSILESILITAHLFAISRENFRNGTSLVFQDERVLDYSIAVMICRVVISRHNS